VEGDSTHRGNSAMTSQRTNQQRTLLERLNLASLNIDIKAVIGPLEMKRPFKPCTHLSKKELSRTNKLIFAFEKAKIHKTELAQNGVQLVVSARSNDRKLPKMVKRELSNQLYQKRLKSLLAMQRNAEISSLSYDDIMS